MKRFVFAFLPLFLALALSLSAAFPAEAQGGAILIAYDTFTRSNGAPGSTETTGPNSESLTAYTWTGSGAEIASNALKNTPTLGSNVAVNGTFDADSNWIKNSGWTISGGTANGSSVTNETVTQNTLTTNRWYQMDYDITSISGGNTQPSIGGRRGESHTATGSYTWISFAASSALGVMGLSSFSGSIDNIVAREISQNTMFATINPGVKEVNASVKFTRSKGPGGVVVNLDSASNPQNYVIGYLTVTGTTPAVRLTKSVNGTLTQLLTVNVTYSAGAVLEVRRSGTSYSLYYGGTQRGTTQTISDASIVDNTLHGVFSAEGGNTLDDFALYDANPATPTATPETPGAPSETPTATHTPTETLVPTATNTAPPYIVPTDNAEGVPLSSGNTLTVRREITFGDVGLMVCGLALGTMFGTMALVNYLKERR